MNQRPNRVRTLSLSLFSDLLLDALCCSGGIGGTKLSTSSTQFSSGCCLGPNSCKYKAKNIYVATSSSSLILESSAPTTQLQPFTFLWFGLRKSVLINLKNNNCRVDSLGSYSAHPFPLPSNKKTKSSRASHQCWC